MPEQQLRELAERWRTAQAGERANSSIHITLHNDIGCQKHLQRGGQ